MVGPVLTTSEIVVGPVLMTLSFGIPEVLASLPCVRISVVPIPTTWDGSITLTDDVGSVSVSSGVLVGCLKVELVYNYTSPPNARTESGGVVVVGG